MNDNSIEEISLSRALEMEELGVIVVSAGMLSNNVSLVSGAYRCFVFADRVVLVEAKEDTTLMYPVFTLTAFGKTLSALILFEKIPDSYVDRFVAAIKNTPTKISIAKILGTNDDGSSELSDWSTVQD